MNVEKIIISANAGKTPGMVRFLSGVARKLRVRHARRVSPGLKSWMNYAGQVELPSQRWLKNSELTD